MEAVFISDLHLSPQDPAISQRFDQFLTWIKGKTQALYILGDFLQVWPGDDALDDWHENIAKRLHDLVDSGICCYFMPGNRDFLLGQRFAALTGWMLLPDPTLIHCTAGAILLSHGDCYCADDLMHQRFRRLTRNKLFKAIFTRFPLSFRQYIVQQARNRSTQANRRKSSLKMEVCAKAVLAGMQRYGANILIHGHTHRPQRVAYGRQQRYVLSDWDDSPILLCYYKSQRFEFSLLPFTEEY